MNESDNFEMPAFEIKHHDGKVTIPFTAWQRLENIAYIASRLLADSHLSFVVGGDNYQRAHLSVPTDLWEALAAVVNPS